MKVLPFSFLSNLLCICSCKGRILFLSLRALVCRFCMLPHCETAAHYCLFNCCDAAGSCLHYLWLPRVSHGVSFCCFGCFWYLPSVVCCWHHFSASAPISLSTTASFLLVRSVSKLRELPFSTLVICDFVSPLFSGKSECKLRVAQAIESRIANL